MKLPSHILYRLDLEMEGLPLKLLKKLLCGKVKDGKVEVYTNTIFFIRHVDKKVIIVQDDLMEFEDFPCPESEFMGFLEGRY
ncbi:hypothetical protein [Parasedimentitalea huanghaiensis]|uniref:Uncharacterized protein n=1 Tax=Parasedimentitalea huanghaiensis TaxID=2682100 RepID=A0A6L6WFX3_9RHOB|nr:hypothetical protein [Zongyanglinia huanghaiensis]MVO16360.1 hypothetical protein [Zongyanglinia huanghaiensis]